MKKVIIVLLFALLSPVASVASDAVHFYEPTPSQFYQLPHDRCYSWCIQWTDLGETISSAVLTDQGIYDWTYENGNSISTHLLDNPPPRVV